MQLFSPSTIAASNIKTDAIVFNTYKFEPIIQLETFKITAYEALSKVYMDNWLEHDINTLTNVHEIDQYMIKKVSKQSCYLNINLSSDSILLIEDDLIESAATVRPGIVIEWIEDRCSTNVINRVAEKLKRWRENYGIRFALDDMGKGQDAYERFLSLKPDFAKIDGSILHGARNSSSFKRALKSYCNFCNEENVPVIVEWIESQRDLDLAMECNASYGQGFFIQDALG